MRAWLRLVKFINSILTTLANELVMVYKGWYLRGIMLDTI